MRCISTPNFKAGLVGPLLRALRSPLDAPAPLTLGGARPECIALEFLM